MYLFERKKILSSFIWNLSTDFTSLCIWLEFIYICWSFPAFGKKNSTFDRNVHIFRWRLSAFCKTCCRSISALLEIYHFFRSVSIFSRNFLFLVASFYFSYKSFYILFDQSTLVRMYFTHLASNTWFYIQIY